jgi:histidyl-tRNA synthetase
MIQLIRGFKDILPGETELWQFVERSAADIFHAFGFREIRIPLLERTELFARGIGEDTDIVEKEMYTFPDRGGEAITLRPEATAGVVRAYIEHKLYAADPVQKLYTIGPMFRRERPQKGRYRQFYQINAEVFGLTSPLIDAQLILLLTRLFARLGVTDATAQVNSLGCPACRPAFKQALLRFVADRQEQLCSDCRRRQERNPLRVLDCKVPGCRAAMQDAPSVLDHLCNECRAHFAAVTGRLDALAVPYAVNRRLVRGLDYYVRTTFEIQTGLLGAQSAIAGGGRYDGLVQALGGPEIPGIGFAIGLDRLCELVQAPTAAIDRRPQLFIAALGERAQALAFQWCAQLADSGQRVELEMSGRSLKAQMKRADRLGAPRVLILGDSELDAGHALLRDMATRDQQAIPLAEVVARLSGAAMPS